MVSLQHILFSSRAKSLYERDTSLVTNFPGQVIKNQV